MGQCCQCLAPSPGERYKPSDPQQPRNIDLTRSPISSPANFQNTPQRPVTPRVSSPPSYGTFLNF